MDTDEQRVHELRGVEEPVERMSLEVGGDPMPIYGTVRVRGAMRAEAELPKGAEVLIEVTDADGRVIASGRGHVSALSFREHRRRGNPPWTERSHQLRVDDA